MSIVTLLFLIFIAAVAAAAFQLIVGWNTKGFIALLVALAIVLLGPTLIPLIIGA